MKRRVVVGFCVVTCLAESMAQPAGRVHRVGVLRASRPPQPDDPQFTFLRESLRELGYELGRDLVMHERFAHGNLDRLPELAAELVGERVDVIVAVGSAAARAASRSTIPIVFFGNFDPVQIGLVENLAHPGGNITGVVIAPDGSLAGKRIELLKAAVPRVTRVGLLLPDDPVGIRPQVQDLHKAARALELSLHETIVHQADYATAFDALARARVGALVVASHTYFVRDRKAIIELAARHRLPAIYEWREQVEDGGLMAYSTSLMGLNRRLASYVDRILKGMKAGDLPVERPYRFELVINLTTARALGLEIPRALLLRADEVIE